MKNYSVSGKFACFAILVIVRSDALLGQCAAGKQQAATARLEPGIKIEFDRNGVPARMRGQIASRPDTDPVQAAVAVLREIGDIFCVSPDDDFAFTGRAEKKDKFGQTAIRIGQKYRGLEVVGPELVVNMTRNQIIQINGQFVPGISVPTRAVISGQDASQVALQHITTTGGSDGKIQKPRELVVYVDDKDKAFLAYSLRVTFRDKDGPEVDDIFVDAIAGSVVGVRALMRRERTVMSTTAAVSVRLIKVCPS